jgi:hypothetical protein
MRQTCTELGLADTRIVDYLADVLVEFAHADRLYRLQSAAGTRLDTIAEMVAAWHATDVPADPLLRQRALRRYVGDYTLFMSGLFRSHVEHRGVLDLYFEQGRHAYWKVSELDLARYRAGFLLFQDLSKKFEYYSGALDYMRKTQFASAPGVNPFADFLKRVEQWVRIGTSSN